METLFPSFMKFLHEKCILNSFIVSFFKLTDFALHRAIPTPFSDPIPEILRLYKLGLKPKLKERDEKSGIICIS